MWSHHILGMVDRKGFGDYMPDVAAFHRVFHGLSEDEQHLVKLNVVGAFQTAAQKAKWDEDTSDICELCGQSDTREHRLLSCLPLQDVRDGAKDACEKLQHVRQEWVYLPIPRAHDQLTVFRAFVMSVKPQHVIAPRNCDLSFMRFFTDGSARYPRHDVARIATWAVVQDTSTCEQQMRQAADFLFLSPPQFPKFHVSAVGIVPGDQTVARAELFAILHAAKQVNMCDPIPCVEFVTDASYVCRVVEIINNQAFRSILHKFSNGDLILELSQFWQAQWQIQGDEGQKPQTAWVSEGYPWSVVYCRKHVCGQCCNDGLPSYPIWYSSFGWPDCDTHWEWGLYVKESFQIFGGFQQTTMSDFGWKTLERLSKPLDPSKGWACKRWWTLSFWLNGCGCMWGSCEFFTLLFRVMSYLDLNPTNVSPSLGLGSRALWLVFLVDPWFQINNWQCASFGTILHSYKVLLLFSNLCTSKTWISYAAFHLSLNWHHVRDGHAMQTWWNVFVLEDLVVAN